MNQTKFSDYLHTKVAEDARKIIDYYDGKQEEHLIKQLNDVNSGRKDWRVRGLIARFRNITKMIINKSGLLISDKLPNIEVHNSNGIIDESATLLLSNELILADYEDTLRNIDPIIRALGTARILVQYDPVKQKKVFDILGLHNSATVLDEYKNLITLIYQTSANSERATYRVFTNELIQDIEVNKDGVEVISKSIPNPYGMIPVANFHDTVKPRMGDYNIPSTDIVQLNEIVNLHITDSEYAIKYMKYGTWVTNCNIDGSTSSTTTYSQEYNRLLPVAQSAPTSEVVIGPSQVVHLNTMGVDSVFFEWKSPDIQLQPLDDIITSWVHSYASDWSVNIKTAGQGTASSGFQLVVEEIDNLELKKQRAKQFSVGLEEVCTLVMQITNLVSPGTYNEELKPIVTFSAPILPVDEKQEEDVWSLRLREGRASRIEYFMTKFDLTKEQAQERIAEIDAERNSSQVATLSQMKNVPNAPNVQKFMVGN